MGRGMLFKGELGAVDLGSTITLPNGTASGASSGFTSIGEFIMIVLCRT